MENSQLRIPVVLGTAREGRRSENVARYVHQEFAKTGVQTEVIDVKDFNQGLTVPPWADDPKTVPWKKQVAAADGFIIVTPEYNYGYPGELKMLLDQALEEYKHKPVGLCGVSSGNFGGTRAIEALKLTAVRLGLVPVHPAASFTEVKELFTEDGQITDSSYRKYLEPMFEELIWYAKALKVGRESG